MIQVSTQDLLMLIGELKISEFKLTHENLALKRELDALKATINSKPTSEDK